MPGPTVERIAHFRIEQRIGRGGMGIVYRAADERDGRVVALKVIRETETSGVQAAPHVAEARVRFAREAGILKSLLHVNIVSFLEIGEDDGSPYLAMEYLEGRPITSFAGRPYTETVPLLIQAAHGMEVLASRGIVHRDLSPDNIFVVESGGERIVKLLDFGIAKLLDNNPGYESLTATGFFLGKVAYGSPEQLGYLGHGAPLDWRSDVYSLGAIFYEVLAGRRPFEGVAPVEYIAAHLNQTPPPVAAPAGQPPLPVPLVRLISQMLEKRRDLRPQTYREIVDVLVSVLRAAPRGPSGNPAEPEELTPVPGRFTNTIATVLIGGARGRRLSEEEKRHARRKLAQAIAAVLILAGATALLVASTFLLEKEGKQPLQTPLPVARRIPAQPAPVSGTLRVLATPYANILSITDQVSKKPLALPSGATTPLVLEPIPAGRYRVVLKCASLDGQEVERDVRVEPGQQALLTEAFATSSELAQSLGLP